MRLPNPLLALLAGALASSPLTACHSFEERELRLEKRVGAGASCGPSAGSAVCNTGLCCSEAGVCGTGGEFCAAPGCQLSYGPACHGNQIPAGADTSDIPRPRFGSVPYGVDITECVVKGQMALTFDDGPYIYTNELLDILKRNDVRATFFVVGNNGAKGQIQDPSSGYPPIIRRMITEGHQVGSHSWSHQDLELVTPAQRRAQIINNEISLQAILGVVPTYFRPPYTSCGGACYGELSALGYHVVNYDLDTRDWENGGVNAKSRFQSAVNSGTSANTGWITLAHDIQEFTVHGFVQWMIDVAKGLGYELVTVGECLADPPANWYRDPATGGPKDIRGTSPEPTVQRPEDRTSKTSSSSSSVILPTTVSRPNFGAAAEHTSKPTFTSSSTPSKSSTTSAFFLPSANPTSPPATSTSASSASNADKVMMHPGLFGSKVLLGLVLGVVGMWFMVAA